MIDLWPEDISASSTKTPLAILTEQAALLGRKTNNFVEAKVKQSPLPQANFFSYQFLIEAKTLGYTYRPFEIKHSIDLYPVDVVLLDSDIADNILGRATSDGKMTTLELKTESQFIDSLREIFKSEKVKKVISALLAQVNAATSDVA
jgi:hypothetical protein